MRGTLSMALCFKKSSAGLQGFVDAGLGGDMENRKSTSSYAFTWGEGMSRLQKCVALVDEGLGLFHQLSPLGK